MYPQSSYHNILSIVYNNCIAMFAYAIVFKCEGIIACQFFCDISNDLLIDSCVSLIRVQLNCFMPSHIASVFNVLETLC